MKICCESGEVSGETVTSWKGTTPPNNVSNYSTDDIWNMDETGVFWQLCLIMDLARGAMGGSGVSEELPLHFFVSASVKQNLNLLSYGNLRTPPSMGSE